MGEAIRLLHFADLHIGMESYGRLDPETGLNRRVVDFLERLDDVVTYAIEHEADAVLFAGDAFRTRTPSPTHQREFARRIRRLSEAAIPTVLLEGNHDVPVMAQRASSIAIFETLAVPHVTVVRRPTLLRLQTRHGLLQVAAIPYPVHQRLLTREQFRRLSPEELEREVARIVLGEIHRLAAQVDVTQPAILLGHFSVDDARPGSEQYIMVGREVTLPISELADPLWDYVALGHIHRHQVLGDGGPPVVYSGSLERVDFGEADQPKGFCRVEVRRGETRWQFVPLKARPFVTVRVDIREAADPAAAVRDALRAHDLTDAVVRLVLVMSPGQEALLRDNDLMPLLRGAFFVQINREVERVVRDRLEGLEPDEMTPLHLLERYLLAGGTPPDELPLYLQEAKQIFADSLTR